MPTQNLSFSKTLSPSLSHFPPLLHKTIFPILIFPGNFPKTLRILSLSQNPTSQFPRQNARDVRSFAGRSKKDSGGGGGRLDGNAEVRREARRNARRRSKKMAESLFYRLKNPNKNYPDNFTEEELQTIGLGYDRMVRFMEKDDPNLRHPHDWYKYGQFGPYSWRGVVLGEPIRGDFTDERVTIIGEVKDHEEWDKIEQHEMHQNFHSRLNTMRPKDVDSDVGLKYFWVFVRHPRWRISDLPWQQWTLVCEVAVEAGKQRLDKWNLMGRLGNKTRALITKCAAWWRPDIVYVKRPVYQCRFEPQDEFFKGLRPLLDPDTERDFLCELEDDDGRVELVTYYGGLCKIVKVNPKAYVDDVVKGFVKLSDEKKSKCLEFLLGNHPVELLHPYTKEWKAKLEEMELGCDAPDDDDDHGGGNAGEEEVVDWIEDEGDDEEGDDDGADDVVMDMDGDGDWDGDNELGMADDGDDELDIADDGDDDLDIADDGDLSSEEDDKDWDEEFKKALSSNEAMENIAKRSMEASNKMYSNEAMENIAKRSMEGSNKMYRKHLEVIEEGRGRRNDDGDELALRSVKAKVNQEEWRRIGYGPFRKKIKKSRIPPGLFLRAAVRPFTYKNLVKEIVLMRHAILEGEIRMTN